ncbi:MAG: flagellar hook-associated protein FlgK [Paracoccaceae bacterium]|nr:flagellar hook-associated protein FlgK [Paracoccaceae bacterium]
MSLSGALYNAFSGLSANARAASLVSTNISNATTEGYGRRTLDLSSAAAGLSGGVRQNGVVRASDPILLSDRRLSDAQSGFAGDMQAFSARLEDLMGDPSDPGSLTGRAMAFESALITAASNPASTQRLESVAISAQALARELNSLSDQVQDTRQRADTAIGAQVDLLNTNLARIDQLNDDIGLGMARNGEVSSLLDERQRLIDGISDIVPLRVVPRDRGAVSLFTIGGGVLLDGGTPSTLEFTKTPMIAAGDTVEAGHLSGLTLNGNPVDTGPSGFIAGGSLAAQFAIRDDVAVTRQAQLDGIARDLAERLGPGGPDTTLGATDPGLFTDAGLAFDAANEAGFAGRIRLNVLVEPNTGGSWRLRDGLGAAAPGEVGDARLLQAISAALTAPNAPGSTALNPAARGFVDHTSEFASDVAGARVRADAEVSFASAQQTALKELELAKGVDTDQELQRLMQIEQQYAANAQVMSVVDDLMQRLLNI